VAEREKEALALRSHFDCLNESFEGTSVLFAGDFNVPPANPAWGPVSQIAAPLITNNGNTLR